MWLKGLKALPNSAYKQFQSRSVKKDDENLSIMERKVSALKFAMNYPEGNQEPILHDAVRHRGSRDVVEAYLSDGAEPNQRNKQGQTPLDVAIEVDAVEAAQLLMRNGATASDAKLLEKWITSKTSSEVAAFLHAGYQPLFCKPPEQVTLPIRVLWLHSRLDWIHAIRAEVKRSVKISGKLSPFLEELARQRFDDPLFHPMPSQHVFLLAWGNGSAFPCLGKEGWNYLAVCLKANVITSKRLIKKLLEIHSAGCYVNALNSLSTEKPEGVMHPFYDIYVRQIKLGLFGTMRQPDSQTLIQMAEKLEWHPKEWLFIQRSYRTSLSPKKTVEVMDQAIQSYLRGIECISQDQRKAEKLFRKARKDRLPRAFEEEAKLLIGRNAIKKGLR